MPELNDPRAGDFEGGSADDHQHWLQAHGLPAPNPGGESQLDALRRYARAYRKIAGLSQGRILAVAQGMPIAWLRSAHRSAAAGGSGRPHADFADPGVAFAGTPDRMNGEELVAAAAILERLAAQSG